MKIIGFLGPVGTFSHQALVKYAGDEKIEARMFNSIQDMLDAVNRSELDEAVAPIENSIEGAVNATMDKLTGESSLQIKAEMIMPVSENLLIKKSSSVSQIKFILSHPQALGQCSNYICKNFPEAKIIACASTAAASSEVAAGTGEMASIGSEMAAEAYGLEIADKDIQDNSSNCTRFVIVALADSEKTGRDKTSIAFSTEDKPGSLYKILDIFGLWDINLCRIESRPAKHELGRYVFLVDFDGHRDDEDIKEALSMVKRKTSYFRLLGSYPVCNQSEE